MFCQLLLGFCAFKHLFCGLGLDCDFGIFVGNGFADVVYLEIFLHVYFTVEYIFVVDVHKISASDVQSAIGEHIFLIRHILSIHLKLIKVGATFHLVDCIALWGLVQQIDGTIASVVYKGCFGNVLSTFCKGFLCGCSHRSEVEALVPSTAVL